MREMKYVIIESFYGERVYIFSNSESHADVANKVLGKPISAGFCRFHPREGIVCYGESTTLGIKSRPDIDSRMVNRQLGVWLLPGDSQEDD